MRIEVAIDEPVDVKVGVVSPGTVAPKSFHWQGQVYHVSAYGRRWDEEADGRRLRCLLVQSVERNAYELRWDVAADNWLLFRAWLMAAV